MLRSRLFRATLAVTLAFSLSSCDSAGILDTPTDAAPQFGAGGNANGNGKGRSEAPGQVKKTLSVLATVPFHGGSASLAVEKAGGVLGVETTAGGVTYYHSLLVGKNTVRSSTLFTMDVVQDGYIGVDLSATSAGGAYNDVGSEGFKRPPTLCLNVEAADPAAMDAETVLSIAWDVDENLQKLVPIPSYRITDPDSGEQYVCGVVDHFSRFVVIHN